MGIAAISSLKSDRATCMQGGRGVALKSSSSEQAFRVLVNSKSESKECCGCQEKVCLAALTEICPLILNGWYASKSPKSLFTHIDSVPTPPQPDCISVPGEEGLD